MKIINNTLEEKLLEKNYSRCTTGIYTGSFIIQHIFK